ncbi:hypothetical protein VTJ49DRAFT_1724 [Mycothermus thermophilus]|uniref:Fungal lipase-like domain-containing protein n=1 Tax=Humicola insolens TaxID=85995 RepID=A0ABR3VCX9_HUMIN
MDTASFHYFALLPRELQIQIWEVAASAVRVLFVNPWWYARGFGSSNIPPLLHVNRQSRHVCQRIYNIQIQHQDVKGRWHTYILAEHDILALNRNDTQYPWGSVGTIFDGSAITPMHGFTGDWDGLITKLSLGEDSDDLTPAIETYLLKALLVPPALDRFRGDVTSLRHVLLYRNHHPKPSWLHSMVDPEVIENLQRALAVVTAHPHDAAPPSRDPPGHEEERRRYFSRFATLLRGAGVGPPPAGFSCSHRACCRRGSDAPGWCGKGANAVNAAIAVAHTDVAFPQWLVLPSLARRAQALVVDDDAMDGVLWRLGGRPPDVDELMGGQAGDQLHKTRKHLLHVYLRARFSGYQSTEAGVLVYGKLTRKVLPNLDLIHDDSSLRSSSPPSPPAPQASEPGVSLPFFASLERAARLVDITYCVGTTGISPPFSCVSRCKDFPSLHLERTWNTGALMSDSCGYIAVDHGTGKGTDGGDDNGREVIVAFRGTYSITNTIVDLSTVPQEYVPYPGDGDDDDDHDDNEPPHRCPNCTVHMGFMSSWRAARDVVLPALHAARARHKGYRVHLIGHSLGGAVAALAALELRLGLGWRDVYVTTFGEPRVGNKALARYIDRAFGLDVSAPPGEHVKYRRVTHVGDPVPLLPPTEWGYRSHAGEVYIGKSELPPEPEDLRLCSGDADPECMAGAETEDWFGWAMGWLGKGRRKWWLGGSEEEEDGDEGVVVVEKAGALGPRGFPARLKLWQLFFAHRDYFWRLGLCLPGGDPTDWWREKHNLTKPAGDGLELSDL